MPIIELNTDEDWIEYFGETRILTREELEKRGRPSKGSFQPLDCFDDIGKRVRFKSKKEVGILSAIGEDNHDYCILVVYENKRIWHSPIEGYEIV